MFHGQGLVLSACKGVPGQQLLDQDAGLLCAATAKLHHHRASGDVRGDVCSVLAQHCQLNAVRVVLLKLRDLQLLAKLE